MNKVFNIKITSDLVFNTLCGVTMGIGVAEYSLNIFLNKKYIKYFKEAFKYVDRKLKKYIKYLTFLMISK